MNRGVFMKKKIISMITAVYGKIEMQKKGSKSA